MDTKKICPIKKCNNIGKNTINPNYNGKDDELQFCDEHFEITKAKYDYYKTKENNISVSILYFSSVTGHQNIDLEKIILTLEECYTKRKDFQDSLKEEITKKSTGHIYYMRRMKNTIYTMKEYSRGKCRNCSIKGCYNRWCESFLDKNFCAIHIKQINKNRNIILKIIKPYRSHYLFKREQYKHYLSNIHNEINMERYNFYYNYYKKLKVIVNIPALTKMSKMVKYNLSRRIQIIIKELSQKMTKIITLLFTKKRK